MCSVQLFLRDVFSISQQRLSFLVSKSDGIKRLTKEKKTSLLLHELKLDVATFCEKQMLSCIASQIC